MIQSPNTKNMKHELPQLPYSYNALEPFIDAQTMELHHAKHHQTYVNKLNEALEKHPELDGRNLEDILKNLESIPEDIRSAVKNHGGGHYNHTLFWSVMAPAGSTNISSVEAALIAAFGSADEFKKSFTAAAIGQFGSGWAWLIKDSVSGLKIVTSSNQDCPLSSGQQPILCLDVWEHAYYLKFQNRRAEYIENWWSVVNWDWVSKNI